MKRLFVLVCLAAASLFVVAQTSAEAELAEKYFQDGEYESALDLFLKLHKKQPSEDNTLRTVACYEMLQQFDEAISFLSKSMKRRDNQSIIYPIVKANLLEKTGDIKGADKLYEETITKDLRLRGDFVRVGAFLYQGGKLGLANQVYKQARKRLKEDYIFANELANIHAQQGEFEDATTEYLNVYYNNPDDESAANLAILNLVSPSSSDAVERALLTAVDKKPNDRGLRSMLFEFYVQAENFQEAFLQVKSIDRLFKADGGQVLRFAETMRNSKNYELSNEAYDYIINRRQNSPYYQQSFMEKAINGELKAFDQIPVDMVAVQQAVVDYGELLDEFGR
ncbi:MAG: tetratricopeptide repeat protein, partial [Bacteroidota bacterium]